MTARLELVGVRVSFRGLPVVRGIDLSVPPGVVVAILGPSGAGKSALLGAISGAAEIEAGEVRVDGQRIEHLEPHERVKRGVLHLPDRAPLFDTLSVRDNLRLAAAGRALGGAEASAGWTTVFPEVEDLLERPAAVLSGGERQMVALTRAIVAGARVLLADDLLTGLAPRVVARLAEPLERLRSEGCVLVVAQQRLRLPIDPDLCVLLDRGAVRWVGEPGELGDLAGPTTP